MSDKNDLDQMGSLVPERLARHWFDVANDLRAENDRLKADVLRLTDAGEHLLAFAHNCVELNVYPKTAQGKIDTWNAAVNGKSL
jgi:hypothetical protein